jgi:hypothetical protein
MREGGVRVVKRGRTTPTGGIEEGWRWLRGGRSTESKTVAGE